MFIVLVRFDMVNLAVHANLKYTGSSVDGNISPVDPARPFLSQHRNRPCYLLRCSDTWSDRSRIYHGLQCLSHKAGCRVEGVSSNRPRRDSIDGASVFPGQLSGPALGIDLDKSFGTRVDARLRPWSTRHRAADVDDTGVIPRQILEHGAGEEEDTSGIKVDDIMPRLVDLVIVRIVEKRGAIDPSAVNKYVDFAEGFCGRIG